LDCTRCLITENGHRNLFYSRKRRMMKAIELYLFFACGCPVSPTLGNFVFPLFNCFCIFVKNQLDWLAPICSWILDPFLACVCSPTTVTLWVTVATELYFPASELFWPFSFQMNLREGLSVFTKQLADILVTMVLNLQICLRELACLLHCLPIHEHSMPLHLLSSLIIFITIL